MPKGEKWFDHDLEKELVVLLNEHYKTCKYQGFIYIPASCELKSANCVHEKQEVEQHNQQVRRFRKMWSSRIRRVYEAIDGYESKPALLIHYDNIYGECVISLEK